MKTRLLLGIIFLLTTVLFFLQNSAKITVDFLFFSSIEISIGNVIIISAILGAIVMYGLFSIVEERYRKSLRIKNKNINKLKKEISKLNNEKFGEDVELDEASNELYDRFLKSLKEKNITLQNEDLIHKDEPVKQESSKVYIENKDENIKISKDMEKIKKAFSSFDEIEKEKFSIKTTTKKDDDEPWFNKPFFKRKLDIQIHPKKQEKDILDDMIKTNIDEILANNSSKKIIKKSKNIKKIKKQFKNLKLEKKKESTKLDDILKSDDLNSYRQDYKSKKMRLSSKGYKSATYEKNSLQNTLSVNTVQEKFNWPYDKEEQEKDGTVSTKNIKIKELFSNDESKK